MMNRYVMVALLALMGGSAYGAGVARAKKTPQQQFASLRRKFADEVLAGNQKEAKALLDQHEKTLEAKTNPTLHKRLQEVYNFVFEPTKVKNVDNKAILWSLGYNPKVITNEEAKKAGLVVINADYGAFRAPIAVKPGSVAALTGSEEKREASSALASPEGIEYGAEDDPYSSNPMGMGAGEYQQDLPPYPPYYSSSSTSS